MLYFFLLFSHQGHCPEACMENDCLPENNMNNLAPTPLWTPAPLDFRPGQDLCRQAEDAHLIDGGPKPTPTPLAVSQI